MKYGGPSWGVWNHQLKKHLWDWTNSEYLPLRVGRYGMMGSFLFPIKFVPLPENLQDPSLLYEAVAVRTDAYPMLWILVMWDLALISLFARLRPAYWHFVHWANKRGIMRTPMGAIPSLKDLWFLEDRR